MLTSLPKLLSFWRNSADNLQNRLDHQKIKQKKDLKKKQQQIACFNLEFLRPIHTFVRVLVSKKTSIFVFLFFQNQE
jgi:hypothetical protein